MGSAVRLILATLALSLAWPTAGELSQVANAPSGVALIYHRFGEDNIPSTNIRLEQFDAQIKELTSGGYSFPQPDDFIAALAGQGQIADRSVLVTVDDGYASAAREAWPRLRAAGIPMLFFIATDPIDEGRPGYVSWDDLRRLHSEGVTIGHHGAAHIYMPRSTPEAVAADIEKASARFKEELGFVPDIFAYPYGEFDAEVRDIVKSRGFRAAFAQYSGVAAEGADLFTLPRFPINERYGDIDRYRLVVNARAMPVEDILPASPLLDPGNNPPAYGFSLTRDIAGLSALACYPSHLSEPATLSIIRNRRVEVRFAEPFPPGRNRINCTLPGPNGRWYWLGRYFYVPG